MLPINAEKLVLKISALLWTRNIFIAYISLSCDWPRIDVLERDPGSLLLASSGERLLVPVQDQSMVVHPVLHLATLLAFAAGASCRD